MNEIEIIAKDMMKANGLMNWRFGWNDARTSFGKCKHGSRRIELSKVLTPLRPKDETLNTILHEIAHALVGAGHGHDYVWRSKFVQLGGNGKRCSGMENVDKTKIAGADWVAVCPNGHVHVKYRKPRAEASCGKCSNKFDRRFLLHYEKKA